MPADDTEATRATPRRRAGTPEPPARVERSRHVAATPETLWRVLADRDSRRHVLGGNLDVDLLEGAEGTWQPEDGGVQPVRVDRVDAHRRLVFDWGRDDDASTVDIQLHPSRTGTVVRVVEIRRAALTASGLTVRDTLCLAA